MPFGRCCLSGLRAVSSVPISLPDAWFSLPGEYARLFRRIGYRVVSRYQSHIGSIAFCRRFGIGSRVAFPAWNRKRRFCNRYVVGFGHGGGNNLYFQDARICSRVERVSFWDIHTVTSSDLGWFALYTASLLLLSGLFYRSLIAVAFDRDFAFTRRLPVRLIDYTMVVMVSLCVVLTIRLVGIMLLLSMLTIPQMTVELFTRHYRTILWGSGLLTVAGGVSGLWLAYLLDVPSGACIVFLLIAVYAVARCGLKVYRRCAVRNP